MARIGARQGFASIGTNERVSIFAGIRSFAYVRGFQCLVRRLWGVVLGLGPQAEHKGAPVLPVDREAIQIDRAGCLVGDILG